MKSKEYILDVIIRIISEIRPVAGGADSVEWEGARLIHDFRFDSLDLITLIMRIEEELNVKISSEEIDEEDLDSIANLSQHLVKKLGC